MLGNYRVAAQLVASRVVLSSTLLVITHRNRVAQFCPQTLGSLSVASYGPKEYVSLKIG
jgi:hypothetical protein